MRTIDTGVENSPGDIDDLQINCQDWLNGEPIADLAAEAEDSAILTNVTAPTESTEELTMPDQYGKDEVVAIGQAALLRYTVASDATDGLTGIDFTITAESGRQVTTRFQIRVRA